ncbi:unnamed protein product [Sphenostylis stenocarpa]|uniref:Uncharacterized protein n=1 Tax=Sphenostylis stenocarpa TaxID=92480 RepID=A0AA86W412_9FABA|nr:unnamed protein product [Sphenostylis stenocarpa]
MAPEPLHRPSSGPHPRNVKHKSKEPMRMRYLIDSLRATTLDTHAHTCQPCVTSRYLSHSLAPCPFYSKLSSLSFAPLSSRRASCERRASSPQRRIFAALASFVVVVVLILSV